MTASAQDQYGQHQSGGPLPGYQSRVHGLPGVDEWYDAARGVRTEQAFVTRAVESMGITGLLTARAEARRLVEDDGIRYGGVGEGEGDEASFSLGRSWLIDPLPVVIEATEWAALEVGLRQRAQLLQLVHDDFYGARRLLRDRLVPAEIVLGHPGFVRAADAMAGQRLVLSATDLGRAADGQWTVIADKTAAPSGAGYAMASRRVTSRVMASLHRDATLARLRGFFSTMATALGRAAPEDLESPRVVLLSPGSASETAYDQGFLAALLGFPLVEGDDLSVRDGRVWIRATGRLEEVDVVVRRVDADYSDPLELRGDSQIGLPGLVEATRRGAVRLANPLGAGVLENPGLVPFLPAVARRLLGEELALPSAETWWCGETSSRAHVLARLDTLVVKPIARGRQNDARFGWELNAAERDDLRRRIEAEPWSWVAQDPLAMSTAPVVTPTGLTPGRFVLRAFGASDGETHHLMPGGLGRVNTDAGSSLVSSMTGALAKDVWVLSDTTAGSGWTPAATGAPSLLRLQRRAAVAPRVADNLYWVGRYAERAEGTARLLRVAHDLTEDYAHRPDTPGGVTMDVMIQAASALTGVRPVPEQSPAEHLQAMLSDPRRVGTVAYACRRLVVAAESVRDQLSQDIWHILSRVDRTLAQPPPPDGLLRPQLDNVLESLLAVAGVVHESMVRDQTWGFLDGGIRVERAQLAASLLRATLATERPPIIDGTVTEAVLEASESIITHRRRTAAGEGPAWPVQSAVSLLLLDPGNPRSVAFQVGRLDEALRMAGDSEVVARVATLGEHLASLDLVDLCAGDRSSLDSSLTTIQTTLSELSAELGHRYFGRKPPQRVLLGSTWSGAGS